MAAQIVPTANLRRRISQWRKHARNAEVRICRRHLKSGSLLMCPTKNKKSAEEEDHPKPRKCAKKGAPSAAEEAKPAAVKCDYFRPSPQRLL